MEARKKEEEEGRSSGGSGPPILACRAEHGDAPVDHGKEPFVLPNQPDSLVEDSMQQSSREEPTSCRGETTFVEAAVASPSKHRVLATSVVAAREDQSGIALFLQQQVTPTDIIFLAGVRPLFHGREVSLQYQQKAEFLYWPVSLLIIEIDCACMTLRAKG